ncbi:MAG: hypothetical protein RIQ93_1795 [Verrucomicrobiota bacterium]|jgi:ribosome-associated protein
MKKEDASIAQPVTVRGAPIELCQFMKFGGLADSGGSAKQSVAERRVFVNGVLELRKRRQLLAGDRVTFEGRTIVVQVG